MHLRLLLLSALLAVAPGLATVARAEAKFSAAEPALLTSAGQSADVMILQTLCKRAGVEVKVLPLAQPADLAGMKTLVVAVGGSSKGLGAAGIDADKEQTRLKALLAKARELKLPVLALHIGGESKRGDLSDGLYRLVAAASNQIVVLKDGDQDGFLTKTATASQVPVSSVDKLAAVLPLLKEFFGKK